MNRTTAAQRTNARYDKIWAQYEAQKENEMTHTPGPWNADGTDIYAGPDQLVATTTSMSIYSLQNARLIAAAPALLEALEALSEAVKPTREGKRDGGTFGQLSVADDIARDVIFRAKGQRVG